MKVHSIDRKPILNAKNTGYVAAASLGTAMLTAYTPNRVAKKLHKPAAIIATIFTLLHIGIIEFFSKRRSKM